MATSNTFKLYKGNDGPSNGFPSDSICAEVSIEASWKFDASKTKGGVFVFPHGFRRYLHNNHAITPRTTPPVTEIAMTMVLDDFVLLPETEVH